MLGDFMEKSANCEGRSKFNEKKKSQTNKQTNDKVEKKFDLWQTITIIYVTYVQKDFYIQT